MRPGSAPRIAEHVARLRTENGITPGLAVVLVGEDPASQVYVRNKARHTGEAGMRSFEHRLPAETSQAPSSSWSRTSTATPM